MIKTIFVPASGSDTDTRVFATALAIARPFAGHLRFFHLQLSPGEAAIRAPHMEFAIGNAIATSLASVRHRVETLSESALTHCQGFCEEHGVRMEAAPAHNSSVSASWTQETDDAMGRLMFHARHSDVVVLGRTRNKDYMPVGIIESLLMRSGRPLIIAPDGPAPHSIKTVVVGWKETPEAARALAAALPLLEQAERVVLLSTAEEGAVCAGAIEDVAQQLAWHGITAQVHLTRENSGPVANQLQRVAVQMQADLLVVGGFGQGQFHERIFGGVTQSLIDGAMLPVFMVH